MDFGETLDSFHILCMKGYFSIKVDYIYQGEDANIFANMMQDRKDMGKWTFATFFNGGVNFKRHVIFMAKQHLIFLNRHQGISKHKNFDEKIDLSSSFFFLTKLACPLVGHPTKLLNASTLRLGLNICDATVQNKYLSTCCSPLFYRANQSLAQLAH